MRFIPGDPGRRVWAGFAVAFLIPTVITLWMWLGETIPPRGVTADRMWLTKRRIIQYAQEHQRLPESLGVLPAMPANYDSATRDAWGRPLDYSYDSAGVVTLRSLGADKAVGGEGDNADMIGVFATRDGQGGWEGPVEPWMRDPMRP